MLVVLGSGLLAWPFARLFGFHSKTFLPPMMFNNSGNMGLPLALFAFGEAALPAAMVLFLVENTLHFTVGNAMLTGHVNPLRLLRLPKDIQQDVIGGQLSMGHARALLSLDAVARIKEARDQVVRRQLSVRQTEALVKKLKGGKDRPAPRRTRVDPELADLAARLQRCLGTKVNILPQARGGNGGRIEISYYSADELERLLELFERK